MAGRDPGAAAAPAMPVDGYAVLALDPEQDGACPCARFTFNGAKYRTHCWRTCNRCEYVGLHYEGGTREQAQALADLLTAIDWYGTYEIREGLH